MNVLVDTFEGATTDGAEVVIRSLDGLHAACIHSLRPTLGVDCLYLGIRERLADYGWQTVEAKTATDAREFVPTLTSWGFTRRAAA